MVMLPISSQIPLRAQNGGVFIAADPQWIHPQRVLNSYELIFVKDGVLSLREDGNEFSVRPDETLLLRPGHRHGGVCASGMKLRFYWVHFTLDPASDAGNALDLRQHVRIARPDHMTALFRRLLDDQELFGTRSLALSLLVMLMACEVARSSRTGLEDGAAPSALAAKADVVIQTKFEFDISASSIADELQCNVNYLGRVFRAAYGMTMTEALNKRRIRHAASLLAESRKSIEEIALMSGFKDVVYFRRVFKHRQGLTPSAHRSLHTRLHINSD